MTHVLTIYQLQASLRDELIKSNGFVYSCYKGYSRGYWKCQQKIKELRNLIKLHPLKEMIQEGYDFEGVKV